MKMVLPMLIVLALVGVLCWVFPPFHVRSLKAVREAQAGAQFNAEEYASRFWSEELLPAAEKAVDVTTVLDSVAADPRSVGEQFGRTVGVSSSYYLFVRGIGRVVSADDDSIGLSLQPEGNEAQVVISLGFVFGNAVRDATGLIRASDYPNAQEYNDVSAALNSIVETKVLPRLHKIAAVGKRIEFAGCAEITEAQSDLDPLTLVPVYLKPE